MIVGANGYTLGPRSQMGRSDFDALVIDGGRVVAIGTADELRLQAGARANEIVDVEGATVIPGLIDSHLHVAALGEQTTQLNLEGTTSAAELLTRVKEYAAGMTTDGWILGRGWDDNRFTVKGLPSLQELDDAAGGRPMLLMRICHHAYLANTAALQRAGLRQDSPNPADGYYGRDEHGHLNGRVYENASRPILRAIPAKSRSAWADAVRAGMETALKTGITGVHTDDVRSLGSFDAVWQTYHALIHEIGIRLRVHELVDWHHIDEANRFFCETKATDEWLTRGAAKLFSDGAMGSRTAWLSESYSDQPGWSGTPIYERDELVERVRIAHEKGFGAAVHAIGDAAVDLTLEAMAAAPPVLQRDRLIHAEIVRADLIERMKNFGDKLAIDIQPRFTVSDFPWLADRVGPTRVKYACAWQTLRTAGLHIAGGSDSPIEPVNPILGIHAAHTRRFPLGGTPVYEMQECLSLTDAIWLFTAGAAFAAGQEDRYGSIGVGKPADLTILSRDIVAPSHPDELLDTDVLYTVVGGDVAYSFKDGVIRGGISDRIEEETAG